MAKILGHENIVKGIVALALKCELPHGYIFFGSGMTGKRTVAMALAKYLEKSELGEPEYGEILQDFKLIDLEYARQMDAGVSDSVSIDAVREIKNFLWQKPNFSPKRTLVLDDAEFLTIQAQNALLKLTEEPPASSFIIIITSDIDALLPTITSRLQKIYFGSVPEGKITRWLTAEHGIAAPESAKLAKRAMGKPGLAVRMHSDAKMQKNLKLAEQFLKTPAASRRDFIKKLLEPEDFNLRVFLEALLTVLGWATSEKPSAGRMALWHKALSLYERAADFGLNPRLQLNALLAAE